MHRIAVLIPCYNEALTIVKVVSDFVHALPEGSGVYVYDNNSTDGTAALAASAGAIVRYETQQGKGNVIRRMFREIDAECYILVDGDDTYPASHALEMASKVLENDVDMVIGDRLSSTYFQENKRLFHNFGNTFMRTCINLLFHAHIKDILTGYRAFSYQFVKSFPILSEGFEIETEMTIQCIDKNMKYENTVIDYRDRPKGSSSKLNTIQDGIRCIFTMMRLFRHYRPYRFWSIIAILLAAIATSFFCPLFYHYLQTGLVPQFPTLIVCGFVGLAAVLSYFTGMILETIRQKNRQDFEMELHHIHLAAKLLKNGKG